MQHMTEANALENAPGQTGPAYVRWTMYDVRFGEFPRLRANLAPMYDFRCTTRTTAPLRAHAQRAAVADRVCLCTIYDVRCTIWIIARVAREFSRASADGQRGCVAPIGANRRWGGGESN